MVGVSSDFWAASWEYGCKKFFALADPNVMPPVRHCFSDFFM